MLLLLICGVEECGKQWYGVIWQRINYRVRTPKCYFVFLVLLIGVKIRNFFKCIFCNFQQQQQVKSRRISAYGYMGIPGLIQAAETSAVESKLHCYIHFWDWKLAYTRRGFNLDLHCGPRVSCRSKAEYPDAKILKLLFFKDFCGYEFVKH